jgi:hypothetical protein
LIELIGLTFIDFFPCFNQRELAQLAYFVPFRFTFFRSIMRMFYTPTASMIFRNLNKGESSMSPSFYHGYVCSKLIVALSAAPNMDVITELTLQISGKDYIPDICLYPKRPVNLNAEDIIRMTEMPLLVVEILSPTQTAQDILSKFPIYFDAGVKSCWLVTPFTQTVSVYQAAGQAQVFHADTIIDPVLNIQIPYRAIFE